LLLKTSDAFAQPLSTFHIHFATTFSRELSEARRVYFSAFLLLY